VLAVHGAEAVRHVPGGQPGELVGEPAALAVVLAGLRGVEAQVLQHDHAAGPQCRDRGAGGRPGGVGGELDPFAEQFAQPGRDRCQRVPGIRLAAGTAEMSADDHPGAARLQHGQGRQAGPDPAVVRDATAVERHVEIGAHQHAQALDREVIDRLHCGISSSRRPAG
jgi:hypothetical protein